jgi:hypothetical protein
VRRNSSTGLDEQPLPPRPSRRASTGGSKPPAVDETREETNGAAPPRPSLRLRTLPALGGNGNKTPRQSSRSVLSGGSGSGGPRSSTHGSRGGGTSKQSRQSRLSRQSNILDMLPAIEVAASAADEDRVGLHNSTQS